MELRYIKFWMDRILRRLKWVAHPITVFVTLQIVWVAITLIWVIWFVGQGQEIEQLAQNFGEKYFDSTTVLAILIVGCVLLGMLLVGTIVLFVYYQKQTSLGMQKSSFVSSVTHELKSPLASVQLTLETMKARKLDEETSSKLTDMALADVERLRRLVDQILVAGRLERGMELFEKGAAMIDLRHLIAKVAMNLGHLDSTLAQRIEVEIPDDFAIRTSESGMTLIFTNFLENAIKYSPRDTKIKIRGKRTDSDIQIEIEDQGIGLEKKDRRRIFKMFHRTPTADKKAIPGTGLGLYIVKSTAKALGGRVWAESNGKNQGTTFFLALPQN